MLPLWAIGALAGAAKSELIDRPKHAAKVQSRGIEARFAPLQGKSSVSFSDLEAPDTGQSMLDFGIAGALMDKKDKKGKKGKKDADKAQFTPDLTENQDTSQDASFMDAQSKFGPFTDASASEEMGASRDRSLNNTALMPRLEEENPMGKSATASPLLANFMNQIHRQQPRKDKLNFSQLGVDPNPEYISNPQPDQAMFFNPSSRFQ